MFGGFTNEHLDDWHADPTAVGTGNIWIGGAFDDKVPKSALQGTVFVIWSVLWRVPLLTDQPST